LLQVLGNLVGNALKFTSSGGKVTIKAYNCQEPSPSNPHHLINRVRLEVSDTGTGISPEDQKRIFDRFFRIENKVHTLEGTGLGLSIVRNIVEKHHSCVHVESELGVGTTFWFDLSIFQDKCDLPEVLTIESLSTLEAMPAIALETA
jgi:two-component system sensor histidine kinase NblS